MSRIGRKPITIPSGVNVTLENTQITVKGPKGSLSRELHKDMKVSVLENEISVERPSDNKLHRALHGTTRSVVANMVSGVTEGFAKSLDLVGVGYRANKSGDKLVLNVGYSHPVEITPESGIEFEVPSNTKLSFAVLIKNALVLWQLKFVPYVSLSRIKVKGSSMKASASFVKKVKLVRRNKVVRSRVIARSSLERASYVSISLAS